MRYLNENKILLEEPKDELEVEPIDIEEINVEDNEDSIPNEDESSTSSNDNTEDEEEPTEEVSIETSKEDTDNGVSSMLNSATVSTWNRIDEFTSMIATVKSFGGYENLISIIQSILDDEMIHIGQLQKALSLVGSGENLISQGIEKAEEVIDTSKTDVPSEDNTEDEEVIEDEEETQSEANTDEIEDVEDEQEEDEKKSTKESLTKRCKIKLAKGDDAREIQEMLKACNLKTRVLNNTILVEGKASDIYNASGMIDIPVHEEDLF